MNYSRKISNTIFKLVLVQITHLKSGDINLGCIISGRREVKMVLYKRILAMCEARGISIAKLEKECGLSNATIRRWAKSKPRIDSLAKVATYFDVSIESLLKE